MTCIIRFDTMPVPESTPTDVVETEPRPTRDDEETTLIDRVLEVAMPARLYAT